MAKIKIYLSGFFILCFLYGNTQRNTANVRLTYEGWVEAGILAGPRGCYGQYLLTNGITFRKWYTGVGTGIDEYYWRSVPLFLTIRKKWGTKQGGWFTSGKGGLNISTKKAVSHTGSVEYKNGSFLGWDFGYDFKLAKHFGLLLSAGYEWKVAKQVTTTGSFNDPFNGWADNKWVTTDKYSLHALFIRFGLSF